jgi:hypothetical protein
MPAAISRTMAPTATTAPPHTAMRRSAGLLEIGVLDMTRSVDGGRKLGKPVAEAHFAID